MSNWIDYNLDVLARTPAEINKIAERLNQPSLQLASWIAQRTGESVDEVAENLKGLLEFKTVKNLGYINDEVNKARRFTLAFKDKHYGIVDNHLFEVSDAFPTATFLLEYYDMQASYSGKRVMRAGEVVREVHDGNQKTQGLDWALLDIFAPFRAEFYGDGYEFGSLWTPWLDAVIAAANELKNDEESALPESTNVAGQQLEVTEVWGCLIADCSNAGAHRAPGGAPEDRLCCEHYDQFVAHLMDPLHNPKFPS